MGTNPQATPSHADDSGVVGKVHRGEMGQTEQEDDKQEEAREGAISHEEAPTQATKRDPQGAIPQERNTERSGEERQGRAFRTEKHAP